MSALDDIRYAARALKSAPGFTIISVVTLALGVGLNAAVFTVANAVLIKSLPYAEPDRLVAVQFRAASAEHPDASVPSPALAVWTAQSQTLESAAAYSINETQVGLPSGEPVEVRVAGVSPSLFSVLRVPAVQAGRPFGPEDAIRGAPRVAIVSHAFWRDWLGSARDLTSIRLNGNTAVVGVLPESFQFPNVISPDILMPLVLPGGDVVASLAHVIARLHPGGSPEAAEFELAHLTETARPSFPRAMEIRLRQGARASVEPLQRHLAGDFGPVVLIGLGVAALILLIACANVAGLLMARTKRRERELAIRVALGGTPARVARLLLVESAILAIAGGGVAVLTVQWSLALLRRALIGTAPHAETLAMDATVAAFTIFAAVLASFLCAATPLSRVLAGSRSWDWKVGSASAGRTTYAASRALVIGQVAGAIVLLIGALLLLGTLWRLSNTDLGFDPRNVLTLKVPPRPGTWPQPREAAIDEILHQIHRLPTVVSAAATTALPLDGHVFGMPISVDGQPASAADEPGTFVDLVSVGYFRTMGIALRAGRDFEPRDTANAPRVAIINEAFVRWKKLSTPIGQRIGLSSDPQYAAATWKGSLEIVGVVDEVKDANPGDDVKPILYIRHEQAAPNLGMGGAKIVIRTTADPVAVAEPTRRVIQSVVAGATVYDVQPMERRIAKLIAPQRQRAAVFGLFGVTAVVLAAIGLYGLLAYVVSQEMREFGIRLAIGANRGQIAALVMRRGLQSAAIGLALGLAGAALLTRFLTGLLFGVTATDPATYATAAVIILVVAAVASYLPARRAMHADPVEILRSE